VETTDKRGTRSRFLRQVALTLGIAAGAVAYPAVAHAAVNCCPAPPGACQPPEPTSCGGGQTLFRCDCGACCSYCICKPSTDCYNGPC
jgi:hypothetical protein